MDKSTHEVRLQQWQEIIQAQLTSGQTKREWCRNNSIPEKQFFYWQRRIRKELYNSQASGTVPENQAMAPSRFVEIPIAYSGAGRGIEGFHPEAVISAGNITVGINGSISEELLMSIGKMIRHAL